MPGMSLFQYAQLGVATFAVAAVTYICRLLIIVGGNHMTHFRDTLEHFRVTLERLASVIDRMSGKIGNE